MSGCGRAFGRALGSFRCGSVDKAVFPVAGVNTTHKNKNMCAPASVTNVYCRARAHLEPVAPGAAAAFLASALAGAAGQVPPARRPAAMEDEEEELPAARPVADQ